MGVFLLYASAKGQAFIDRALYLPEEWTQDPLRCQEAGVPQSVEFARHRGPSATPARAGLCSRSEGRLGGGRYRVWL